MALCLKALSQPPRPRACLLSVLVEGADQQHGGRLVLLSGGVHPPQRYAHLRSCRQSPEDLPGGVHARGDLLGVPRCGWSVSRFCLSEVFCSTTMLALVGLALAFIFTSQKKTRGELPVGQRKSWGRGVNARLLVTRPAAVTCTGHLTGSRHCVSQSAHSPA